jgi:hypothetical protein
MCTWRPSMRFSSTVMFRKSSIFWNVLATPKRAIRLGAVRVSSRVASPSTCSVILPIWGR